MICICGVSAADVETAQIQTVNASSVQENGSVQVENTDNVNRSVTSEDLSDSTKIEDNTCITTVNTAQTNFNTRNQEIAATSTSFTLDQIKDAAARVKTWIETKKSLPNYVTIGTVQVNMPDFLKLLTAGLLEINSGSTAPIVLKTVKAPATPIEDIKSGDINKVDYLDLAKRVNTFIDSNGIVPNYASTPLGKIRYENMIYAFSRILDFQKVNNRLPNYVSVTPWAKISIPSDLQKYLVATVNCPVNDPAIVSLAASITNGATSTYDAAAAIFQWVNDHTSYQYYNNTRNGALGTLNLKTGNCCDLTHLVIALERAAGIPARYVHGYCQFTSGNWYGHVWAQVYVDGKWYNADASHYTNTFGVVHNWNTATATIKGVYASLPF